MTLANPNWLEARPLWQKVLAVALLVLTSYALVFWWGSRSGREWADSKYLQEREQRDARLAVLAAQNDALKKENEAKAEILKQIDAANDVKRAEDFARLQEQRKQKSDEIESANPDESLAGLCADAKSAGFSLSFCGGR